MPKLQPLRTAVKTAAPQRMQQAPRIGATERQRGSGWMKRRAKWLSRHPMCCMCQAEGALGVVATEVDHIVPLWEGGPDDETNLQSLCSSHHKAKTAGEAARRGGGVGSLGA